MQKLIFSSFYASNEVCLGKCKKLKNNLKKYFIPFQKQYWIPSVDKPSRQEYIVSIYLENYAVNPFSFCSPLNIDVTEVPKYTIRLGKFHIHSLGTSIGSSLESWSANTCIVMDISLQLQVNLNNKGITWPKLCLTMPCFRLSCFEWYSKNWNWVWIKL